MTASMETVERSAGTGRRPLVVHLCAVEYTACALLEPQMSALRSRGYDVRVSCAPNGERFDSQLEPFAPIDVRFPRSPRPLRIAAAAARWVSVLWRLRPDIVHLHTPAVALTTRALPRLAVPDGTRVAYTVHGFAHVWDDMTRRDRLLERVERALASRTDLILFQSEEDLAHARRLAYPARLVYLGNGVGEHWFELPAPVRGAGPLRLLYAGRLIREKGLLDLFDALERAPNVRLTLAGAQLASDRDGVEAELRARAERPALAGRVTFVGHEPPARMRRHVQEAHALVLPSYREGVPRCLIEGMAAARPALATDVRGCRELVHHGVTGFRVPAHAPGLLAQAMEAMASLPAAAFDDMSSSARFLALTRYREVDVVDRLVQAYASIGVAP